MVSELDLDEDEEELTLDEQIDVLNQRVEREEEVKNEEEIEEVQLPELSIDDEENLEELIESAEEELTQEDLDSEIDLDEFGNITTNEIKLALGEEVVNELNDDPMQSNTQESEFEEVTEIDDENTEENGIEESNQSSDLDLQDTQITPDSNGVEALKKLLEALSNADVKASMQGMKININFELGDK